MKHRISIDIDSDILDSLRKKAIDEKRRGKRDVKNFIEDLVEGYEKKKSNSKLKK
jgi:hypothetical protein